MSSQAALHSRKIGSHQTAYFIRAGEAELAKPLPGTSSEPPKAVAQGVDASLSSLVSEASRDFRTQLASGEQQEVVNVIEMPSFEGSMSLQAAQGPFAWPAAAQA